MRKSSIGHHTPIHIKAPGEIAQAVAFILENEYFSGRCIEIDGGPRL